MTFFNSEHSDRALTRELEGYVKLLAEEKVRAGMNPDAAWRAALLEVGGVEQVKEEVRGIRPGARLETLWRDVRWAAKSLTRSPTFTVIAVLTLMLGIGANAAIFTFVDAVVLRKLPVRDPDGLVILQRMAPAPDGAISPRSMQYPAFVQMRRTTQFVSGMAAVAFTSPNIRFGEATEPLPHGGMLVSGGFFPLLGISAIRGRLIGETDDAAIADNHVAVLSAAYWASRFRGDDRVIGQRMTVSGSQFTIIGVAPPGFEGVSAGSDPDVYFPLTAAPVIERSASMLSPSNGFLSVLARLRAGVSREQATQELTTLYIRARIETAGRVADAKAIDAFKGTTIAVEPGARGLSFLRRQFRQPLVFLMAMVALVLAMSCANIANLLIARADGRQRDVAVRLALGASRLRLVRQFLIESALLTAVAGVAGLGIAYAMNGFLLRLLERGFWTLVMDVQPDARVLAFTFCVCAASTAAFGLLPALRATRVDLGVSLREGGRGSAGKPSSRRLATALVIAQVCIAAILVTGAGLFVRSILALQRIDIGFAPHNVMIVRTDVRRAGYSGVRVTPLLASILERARALPEAQSVALADVTPLSGNSTTTTFGLAGNPPTGAGQPATFLMRVTPEYFRTIGQPVRSGALFDATAEPPRVVLVNDAFQRELAPSGVLGKMVGAGTTFNTRVVGIVADAPLREVREELRPTIYAPLFGDTTVSDVSLLIRSTAAPATVYRDVRRIFREIDPKIEIIRESTLRDQVGGTMVREQLLATLATAFGALALILASIGIYGVVSQTVVRRTNEIGVRIALGAAPSRVRLEVIARALRPVSIGVALGIPLSWMAAKSVASLLFGIQPADLATTATCAAGLFAIAASAAYVPARRASRIDPVSSLRAD